ncbi:hypothetical protein SNE40_022344 [Patella caerulea]|uniref:Fibrinogen C-terminal domain-containing protein n=1 Tax=Patella caerulea TaxID=87958 RepID=A0AAN8G0F5_PATCE
MASLALVKHSYISNLLYIVCIIAFIQCDPVVFENFNLNSQGSLPLSSAGFVMNTRSKVECIQLCVSGETCLSVAYNTVLHQCYIFYIQGASDGSDFVPVADVKHYIKFGQSASVLVCQNGGVSLDGGGCNCTDGYLTPDCGQRMRDCSDGFDTGLFNGEIREFTIQPTGAPAPFTVLCEMVSGGRTVMQKYDVNPAYFQDYWSNFVNGYVSNAPDSNSFGLAFPAVHYITSSRPHDAMFVLEDDTATRYARLYSNFVIGNEADKFRVTLGPSSPVAGYQDAGDGLVGMNGSLFSSVDQDNDGNPGRHCAEEFEAGWWYNSVECSRVNILGYPTFMPYTSSDMCKCNIHWNTTESLPLVLMKTTTYLIAK